MNIGVRRYPLIMGLCLLLLAGLSICAYAKVPTGYRDIKLGMTKPDVVGILSKSRLHSFFEDRGTEISEIIRGDELFRFATYRFDSEGKLVEIGLEMREILGRDLIIDKFNRQHGLQLTPLGSEKEGDRLVAVKGNRLLLIFRKKPQKPPKSAQASRRAK
jgi:hypothetical protein